MTVGRKPKPKRIKELEGSARINANEPKPMKGAPRMPPGLPERAKKYWRRLTAQLDQMGVLTRADQDALMLLCLNLAIAEEAAEEIAKDGVLREDDRGRRAKNPAWQIFREANQGARQLLTEFGLSPSSRQRLDVTPDAEDEFDAYLRRGMMLRNGLHRLVEEELGLDDEDFDPEEGTDHNGFQED